MGAKVSTRKKKDVSDVTEIMDNEENQFFDKHKGGTLFDKIVLNNKLRVGIAMFIMAVVVPLLVYVYVFQADSTADTSNVRGTCILKPEYRLPCIVGRQSITPYECGAVGCCWNVTTEECHHSIPTLHAYFIEELSDHNMSFPLKTQTDITPFRKPTVARLRYILQPITANHLQIQFKDVNQPIPPYNSTLELEETQFSAMLYNDSFSLEISRRVVGDGLKKNTSLLSTSKGPLIASDNYWELTLQLPSDSVAYGLGRLQLRDSDANPTVLYNNDNNTGSHPVIMSMDALGQTHGIYLESTGPLEIHFIQDSKLLVLRSLSNEGFNIHLFAGPTPKAVLSQFTDLVGRPSLPPYWALGLHICSDTDGIRDDYETVLNDFYKFRNASVLLSLPFDSHCLHEKLLGDLTFDIPKNEDLILVKDALDQLETDGKMFLMTLPLPLATGTNAAYISAVDQGVLVMESSSDGTAYVGEYSGIPVVYPDWTHPASGEWFQVQFQALRDRLGGSYRVAGVVLQDNWPANHKIHGVKEDLVYIPQAFNGSLSNGTLWWKANHANNKSHHEIHNLQGVLHAQQVYKSFDENTTPFLLSASTHPGSGVVSGTHQQSRSNVPAKWTSLKETLISVLGLGLVGIPLTSGGSVCGSMSDFNHTEHEALCLKWYLLSITLPLIRVSSVYPFRDPTTFTSGFTQNAVIKALKLRYTLLPYYYTTFQEAVMTGSPVARPMFLEFPGDVLTRHMDEQFMIGSALLMAPVLVPGAIDVQVYLPNENTTWYQFMGGYQINNGTGQSIVTISTLETDVTILLRGGYIVPTQKPDHSAESSRRNPHHLVVGLNCSLSNQCTAEGDLFLEYQTQETTLHFSASETNITITKIQSAQFLCQMNGTSTIVDEMSVYGIAQENVKTINNVSSVSSGNIVYSKTDMVLKIRNIALDWCEITEDFTTISW